MQNYETILQIIFQWPPTQRFALVQDVLNTLAPPSDVEVMPTQARRQTLNKALGLLSTDRTPPSDSEIKQWLDEHRTEKYS
jgi:hypothetical protein